MLRHTCGWLSGIGLMFLAAGVLRAAPPSETLLPATTKAFVSVANVEELIASWSKTEFGQLLEDPIMEPFKEDLHHQLSEKGAELRDKIGMSLADLDGLASGELAFAMVKNPRGKATVVALADVSKNLIKTQATLNKMEAYFARGKAQRRVQTVGTVKLITFDVPARGPTPASQVSYFLNDGFLVISDSHAVTADIQARLAGARSPSLADHVPYKDIMARCTSVSNSYEPNAKWYVEPVGLVEIILASTSKGPPTGPDPVEVLRSEGFEAIQGIGGLVSFAAGPYGLFHRTLVYAPGGDHFVNSMRMLRFPNGVEAVPQSWISHGVASYTTFHCDLTNAFKSFGTLFDATFGEGETGSWSEIVDSIKTDPHGPMIDLLADLVALLTQRVTVVTDVKQPVTPHSQRRMLALEITPGNEERVARSIERMMKNDKSVKQQVLHDHRVYIIVPEEHGVPELNVVEGTEAGKPRQRPLGEGGLRRGNVPNTAITVAHGHLFVSSHVEMIEEVLANPKAATPLASDADYQVIGTELAALGNKQNCLRGFARNAESWMVTYELFRMNRLPEADTALAQALNVALNDGIEGELRKPRLDGSKLPPFENVRHFLGTGGTTVTSENNGWLVVGFTLNKNADQAAQARRPR